MHTLCVETHVVFLLARLTIRRVKPIVCILVALLGAASAVQAQFTFTTNNGAITITGYSGSGGVVVIPGATNGFPVTSIANSAVQLKSSVTSVIIPNSVTNIGLEAFNGCSSLTNVTIGNSVTNLGNQAFWNCAKLTSVTIPNSVVNIGYGTFYSCSNLANVTIGSGVTNIANSAFFKCSGLTNVSIPNSVTSIGQQAFFDCTSLTNVTIGSGATNIASTAFNGCTNLSVITVATLNSSYSGVAGVLFDDGQTTLVEYPGKAGSYTIPNSVTSIGGQAFYDCAGLTGVTIPSSVNSIGQEAFFGCTSLTNVSIPSSVTNIGLEVFDNCASLTAITVNPTNPFYSSLNGVLFDQGQTTLIQYPGGLIGNYTIPGTVTSIGENAFGDCSNLTGVTIPNSVTSIGQQAFLFCAGLTSVTIPNSISNIESETFYGCSGLTSVTIGSGVTNIGDAAFLVCTKLSAMYFLGNAPSIGSDNISGYNMTVYYLPGTTGWGPTFDYVPTMLWNPQPQAMSATSGGQAGQFSFNITGSSNLVVVVEACTNLLNPVWQPVATNTLTGGSCCFSDPQWTNYPGRFYRFRSP